MAVPGRLFFLDCQVLKEREYALSWGWPLIHEKDEGVTEAEKTSTQVVDKAIMHVVIEYRDEGTVRRATAVKSPFIFKGENYSKPVMLNIIVLVQQTKIPKSRNLAPSLMLSPTPNFAENSANAHPCIKFI